MALVLSACSSLFIWPHSMSYFNEVVGGPHNGHRRLLHSSIDWGQDWLFLEKWVVEHPEARKIRTACSGPTPPELIDLESASPPMLRKTENGRPDPASGPEPGWYAVSVNDLHEERYAYFLEFEPVATAGYSIFIFHLEKDEVSYYWKNQKRFERE